VYNFNGVPTDHRAIDFPDPFVLRVDSTTYYAYSTGSIFAHLQVIKSTDNLATWTYVGDPFVGGGSGWSDLPAGKTWGPSVLAVGNQYVLYYASATRSDGTQCVGRAVSASPAGPFVDSETSPMLCAPWLGGSIDPSPFQDSNGNRYLLWKSEGIPASQGYVPTQLWSSPLSGDGLSIVGAPTALLTTDDSLSSWEFPIIEGATMIKNPAAAGYVLLYSAFRWETAGYKVGAASCATPTGPCTRTYSTPVLQSRGAPTAGPGGESVFVGPNGQLLVAFHAWKSGFVGYGVFDVDHARTLRILGLTFSSTGLPKIG
ncbi:MAG: glycoside hydrolase family 43 protein, partial [Acidimicrobiia bacterium]